ncbi:MAG: amidohydrolase family protein [Planctomycetota bacterium]
MSWRTRHLWVCFVFASTVGFARAQTPATPPLVVENVAVIDCESGKILEQRSVLVENGKISAIGNQDEIQLPSGTQRIDGQGKFLIPGLWDMHIHMVGAGALNMCLANGVTGVRDMHAIFPGLIFQFRRETAVGKTPGPRIVAAGAMVDGGKAVMTGAYTANNPEEAKKAMEGLAKQGADFVKVYSKLPRDAYLAIVEEAKKRNLPIAGHVPESVSVVEASNLGQKSMEHLLGVMTACSSQEESLRLEQTQAMADATLNSGLRLLFRAQDKALETFDDQKANALCQLFAKNQTWQVPTLAMLRATSMLADPAFTADERIKYIPPFVASNWKPTSSLIQFFVERGAEQKKQYERAIALVRKMHQAGVPFLAGTDTPNPYCYAGFTLHDELALFVDAGFTPLESLQTATINAARYLGEEKNGGSVAPGKIADLVLLDDNPLADIRNTRKIHAVIRAGHLYDRAALDQLLAKAEFKTQAKQK